MSVHRRKLLEKGMAGAVLITPGCLGEIANSHSIPDVLVHNQTDFERSVQLTATNSEEKKTFDRSFKLAPDGEPNSNKEFTNPFKNGQSYTIVVTVDSRLEREYEWTQEKSDGGQVLIRVYDDKIEMIQGDA